MCWSHEMTSLGVGLTIAVAVSLMHTALQHIMCILISFGTSHVLLSHAPVSILHFLQKKLVLPNMEDLVIPILNSGLAEDKQQELSPPTPQ